MGQAVRTPVCAAAALTGPGLNRRAINTIFEGLEGGVTGQGLGYPTGFWIHSTCYLGLNIPVPLKGPHFLSCLKCAVFNGCAKACVGDVGERSWPGQSAGGAETVPSSLQG